MADLKAKITVHVEMENVKQMIGEIGKLQTYKLFAGDDEIYVSRDDVIAVIENHIVAECER